MVDLTTVNASHVSSGTDPKVRQVFSFPLTLAGASVSVDLKTATNLQRVRDVQGIFVDNSAGTSTLTITTIAGQNVSIPAAYQALMPLYLSADNTITFNGNGTIKVTLLNFRTAAAVWPSTAAASQAVTISGTVQTQDALLETTVGSASGGTAGSASNLTGGIYNTTLPTLTNGQQAALQLSSRGSVNVQVMGGVANQIAFTGPAAAANTTNFLGALGSYFSAGLSLTNAQSCGLQVTPQGVLKSASGGQFSSLGLTANTTVKATPGRIGKVIVQVAPTSIAYVLDSTGLVQSAAVTILAVPIATVAGTVYNLDFPALAGIGVLPGGGTLTISYD